MEIIYDILWQVGKIIFLILTLVAFGVSALILFRPQQVAKASAKFNQWISTESVQNQVDSHIDTDEWIMRHRWWIGGLFLIGALFTLKYLLIDFEQEKFIKLVLNPAGEWPLAYTEIAVDVVKWVLVMTSLVGVLVCSLILVNPESFRRINARLDKMFSTAKVQEAIDVSHMGVDRWVLKNHVLVGSFLFLGSCFLIVFCVTILL